MQYQLKELERAIPTIPKTQNHKKIDFRCFRKKSVQIKRPYYSMSSKFNNTIRIDIDAHYHIHRLT